MKKTFPSATLSATNLTRTDLGSNQCLRCDMPATNRLSLVTAHLRNNLIICKVSVCTLQRTLYAFIRNIIRLLVYRKSSCLGYERYETYMTLLTVIVAGALFHTRLHPSEMRARLSLAFRLTLFHRCISTVPI